MPFKYTSHVSMFFFGLFVTASGFAQYSQPARDTRSAASMPTAEEIKNPPKSWVDKDTGHRIIRLTDEPGSASLYFNVNGYTPAGNEMIYTTKDGVSVLDLRTMKTRSVVTGRIRVIVAGRRTPSVFYTKAVGDGAPEELFKTNVDTGETKMLARIPAHGSVQTVNADETLAAGTYEETSESAKSNVAPGGQLHALDQPANKGEMMVRRLAARIPLVIFTLGLSDAKVTPLLHSTDWIGHMLFSPSDPEVLMYCHEGPWQAVNRIWTIRTDGTHNTLMHQRHMAMEIAGHEFWGWDGETVYYDLQTPKGQDFFLASLDLKDGARTWYHLDRNEWSIHFNVNRDHTLFAGDGGDPGQVAKAPDGEWIYLYHPEIIKNTGTAEKDFVNGGVLHAEKLVNMSKHNYTLEPNVSIAPGDKMVIFRSNMFGPTYVFGVEINK